MNQSLATHINISTPPAWLPPELRGRAIKYGFRFTQGERQIFRKRKKILPSRWVEKHRVVSEKVSVLPGPWRNDVTPYLAGIMDASFHDAVQTIIVCKSPQTGVTEAVFNCVAYATDRDPGPALFVFNDETTARENNTDRIIPMFESSPRLRSYFTGYEDDKASKRIRLKHMYIYLAWATSVARLGNKAIRYLSEDELDKYPPSLKREASPEALAEARTITYRWNRKIWKYSTPTIETGPIWKAMTTEAQVIFDYWVICPLCGESQLMRFSKETFRWPEDERDPEAIESEDLAWYECEHCHGHWNDTLRDRAVRAGQWRSRPTDEEKAAGGEPMELFEYLDRRQPMKIGFHLPSWLSYFVPLSRVAAAFLRSQRSLEAFKDYKNKYEALPWKQVVVTSGEAEILSARAPDLPPQTVPPAAVALTCGIDVQKYGFWFCVRAWAADYTRWLIHYGNLASWEDVERLLFETAYPVQDSERTMRIFRACIDTGGGKKYQDMSMTEETYWWLRDNAAGRGARCWATKGSSRPLAGKLSVGKPLDKTPSGKPLSGGLQIISVDTEKMKDAYHYHLHRAIEGLPQGGYLHAEVGQDYADHILAEEKQITERGIEEWVQLGSRANHLFDADCLAMVAADPEFPGGGIHILAAEANRQKKRRRVISKGIE